MVRWYGLRDDQWEKIEPLQPGRKETVGVTAKDDRLFVEAVLYRGSWLWCLTTYLEVINRSSCPPSFTCCLVL